MKPPSPKLESIDGDRYRLTEDYIIKIGYWLRHLQIKVPENYITNLADIPPILRGFGDRASLGTAAVTFHDWACANRGKLTNLEGDPIELTWFQVQLYFMVMLELDGIPWQRSLAAFLGVVAGNRWDGEDRPEFYKAVKAAVAALDSDENI